MPSLGGITGIIGVRAVIIDVRQYLADGREIERTNDRIAQSTKKVETASISSAKAQQAALAASARANADSKAVIQSKEKLIKLEQQLAAAQKIANAPASGLVGAGGQPIPSAAATAAAADVKRITNELKTAQIEFNTLKGVAVSSFRAETASANLATVAEERHNAALLQQERLNQQLAAARSSRIKAATSATALVGTAVIAGTAAAAISSAAKYQQELSKINVLTSATDEETKQLGERFKILSTQIPVSAADLAEAAYIALSSGIKSAADAEILITQASKAAVAGQGDVKDIVRATIAVLNGYPKGAITASQANDILFAGVKEGAAEFDDFAGSIGKLIPIAAALNVPFDQLTASLAVLTNGGLNAEEAATGLRAILNDLAKDENSKQAQEALAQFGLTVSDLRRKIRDEGLPQAMGELITLFNGNLAAIEPIIPNIRGMVAAFSAFNNNGKTTIGVLNAIDASGGIVDQSFAKTKDNVANLAQIVKNQLNVVLIEAGTAILPSITKALQDLIKWISTNREAIAKFISEGLQTLIDIGKDVAIGIGIIAKALSDLDDVLSTITGHSDLAKVALLGISAGLVWALPGGPIIVGLITITTLLAELTKPGGFGDRAADKLNDFLGLGTKAKTNLSPEVLRPAIQSQGSIEKGVRSLVGGNDLTNRVADDIIKNLKSQGFDVTKGIDEFNKQLNKVNEIADPLSKITLPKLTNSVEGVDQAAKKAAEDLKKLAEEFQKSSEAAGQVESLTAKLKLFGEITPEIAKAFNLTAVQAGNVQGVDAVRAATERATNRSFEFAKALATVAGALQQGGAAAVQAVNEIIHGIAQSALEASQSALSDLLSRPTREVADLGVPLARQQQQTANLTFRNQPQINALNQQLKNIDKQIAAQNRANQIANRAAQRQREQQQKAQQAAQKAQQQAQEAEANARKLANLQAQIAAERQLAALQKLIDANNKSAADLQKAFLKSNNDLQVQINTAIGKGDSTTALNLVEQQRAATKQYREQSKALEENTQNLTTQQKAAQEAEQERQRQQQLADAQFESQQKQTTAVDDNTSSTEDNTDAQDAQTQALEDQKQKIQDQIDALQAPIDASKEQEASIQRSIDLYESQGKLLKAQGIQADKTLKTQEEQWQSAKRLITQIGVESGAVDKFSKLLGIDTLKSVNDANEQFRTLTGLLKTLNDPSGSIAKGFDPVAKLDEILKVAMEDPAVKQAAAADKLKQAADAQLAAVAAQKANITTGQEGQLVAGQEPVSPDVLKNADNLITKLKNARIEANGLFFDYVKGASGLSTITRSISPIEIFKPNALQEVQTITGEAFSLGSTFGIVAGEAANLDRTIDEINPPNIEDAGQQTIINATGAAQTLGFVLGTQVRAPDIGDSGRQTILNATQAARGLGTVLAGIATQVQGLGSKLGQLAANASKIKPPKIPGFSQGGYFTKATLGIIGEKGPEVVLPLNDVKRLQQILQQASTSSPSMVATTGSVDSSNAILSSITNAIGAGMSSGTNGLGSTTGPANGGGGSSSVIGVPFAPADPVARANAGIAWEFARLGYGSSPTGLQATTASSGSSDSGSVPLGGFNTASMIKTAVALNGLTAASRAALNFQTVSSTGQIGGSIGALSPASLAALAFKSYMPGLEPAYGTSGGGGSSVPIGATVAPQQIVAQLSPQLTAQLTAAKPASAVFAPNITVTGQTLDTMEATAIRAVQAAFRDARIMSGRAGGLITTGLGPSHL